MSSISTMLKALIDPLVTGGCHNTVNTSDRIAAPYVVFHEISGVPETGISNDYLGATRYRFQVDVFASSPEMAKGLALGSVKDAITGSAAIQGTLIFQMAGQYSEKDKTFQYITEYQIWAE